MNPQILKIYKKTYSQSHLSILIRTVLISYLKQGQLGAFWESLGRIAPDQ